MSRQAKFLRGFTLIEVLVSLGIFALAAVVLSGTYINILTSYDAVSRSNQHDQDMRLIRGLILAEADRKKAEQGGEFPLPDRQMARWSATVEETRVADLFRVKLSVEFGDGSRTSLRTNEESFLLLRPTWSEPLVRDKLRAEAKERLAKREQK